MAILTMSARGITAGLVAAIGLFVFTPTTGRAEGVKIIREILSGQKVDSTTVFNNSSLLTSALQPQWNSMRPEIEKTMRLELGKGNRFAKGITFYKIVCNLSRNVTDIKAYPSNGFIQIRFRLNGNYLKITSTTPGPLGKWADPTFEIRFDALFIVDITYPGKDLQFKAGTAKVFIQKVRVDSQGVVADVIKLANNVINFFTKKVSGKKVLISAVEAKTYKFSVKLNQVLAGVNQTLKKLGAQKFVNRQVYFDKAAKSVVVKMSRKAAVASGKPHTASRFTSAAKRSRAAAKRLRAAAKRRGADSSLNPQPLPPKSSIPLPKIPGPPVIR